MKDYLVKALACEERVRIYICASTQLVEEAKMRFDLWPTSAAALGRTLSVASMMGSMLKSSKEQLTIRINGGGPIGTILVDAYHDGHVRGFVSDPHIMLQYNDTGKLAVGHAVGTNGYLEVVKDLNMKENWSGTVALQSGEIAEDFAYYFTASEQTPSAVSLGVLVNPDNTIQAAGGMIIQMLPDAKEEDIVKVEQALSKMKQMSTMINESESLEQILETYFDDVKILTTQDIAFSCHCDRASMKRALSTLSKEDLQAMIEEDHGCEITCNFCNEHYFFNEEELKELEGFLAQYGK
ncbi:MAG: Hsp33 family molecular chaperone HslO [Longicatena sp.]|jgi:molecular chaperone Hsp33|nr:Hsp33 family molecular chaperone HslO [Longicatena sp.]